MRRWFQIGCAALTLAACARAQANGELHSRTLSIGGIGRQPRFTLDISATGRKGTVVVRNAAGAEAQALSCDLFRDWGTEIAVDPAMAARILDAHAASFISGLKTADLDFDGLPDILAVRDSGAKWVEYCVWLFDPKEGEFVQNALSRQMEDLQNLTVDAERRQIVAFTIGPMFPSRDEYRIDGRSGFRYPERRLLPVRSCELDTGQTEGSLRISSVVTYLEGQDVVRRRTVPGSCNDACGDGCPTVPGNQPERR
jgi:hypothetical protein